MSICCALSMAKIRMSKKHGGILALWEYPGIKFGHIFEQGSINNESFFM